MHLYLLRLQGSSPRVWGQGDDSAVDRTSPGIIPTRMGTRFNEAHLQEAVEDHPHAYGDKCITFCRFYADIGSSPRVWGQDADTDSKFDNIRIIPTRMGTRATAPASVIIWQHHPHAYGDKGGTTTPQYSSVGSSPRVWGQASKIARKKADERIIPTRMGTSLLIFDHTLTCRDHPHAYGDKYLKYPISYANTGSSPRVWGQVI